MHGVAHLAPLTINFLSSSKEMVVLREGEAQMVCKVSSGVSVAWKIFNPHHLPPHPYHASISQRPGQPLNLSEHLFLISKMGTIKLIPLI